MDTFKFTDPFGDAITFTREGAGYSVMASGPRGGLKYFTTMSNDQANALRWFLVAR